MIPFVTSLLALALTRQAPAPLVVSEVIGAPAAKVWTAFTTKEGQESWQVAHADVDLRIGGLMRTHYDKAGKIGDENTISNEIISYDPERMLSLRIATPPAKFPFKEAAKKIWTVIYFDPVDAGHTKVTCKMLGWTDDRDSKTMRGFFESGNKWVLQKLKERFKLAGAR